jgi:hypothetical protein
MKKKLVVLLLAISLSFAGTFVPQTTQNAAIAQRGLSAGHVVDIVRIIVDVACPEVPRRVCKGQNCEQGACISFRKHCVEPGDCRK